MEIVTRRFLLRDFVEADRPAFLAYQSDPRNLTFYGPGEARPDHAEAVFDAFLAWAEEVPRRNYQFAIAQRDTPSSLFGSGGLRGEGAGPNEMELGIELAPDFWGRYAFAVELGRALLEFGFEELGLDVISGKTVSANGRVGRLAEWFGAEVTATQTGPPWMQTRGWSEVQWRITSERWRRRAL